MRFVYDRVDVRWGGVLNDGKWKVEDERSGEEREESEVQKGECDVGFQGKKITTM